MQFVNILQMRKLREGRGFNVDERIIAGHLVTLFVKGSLCVMSAQTSV